MAFPFYVRRALRALAGSIPYSWWQKGTGLALPYYHLVSDTDVIHIKHLFTHRNLKQFLADLDFFLAYYEPVSLADVWASKKGGQPIPEHALLLSFDDGLREVYDVVLPVLKEHGVPAVFFLNPAFLDNRELFYRHKASILIERYEAIYTPALDTRLKDQFVRHNMDYPGFKQAVLGVGYPDRFVLDQLAEVIGVDFGAYLQTHQPYLTTAQVNHLLNEGFEIGAHSVDHPRFTDLTLEGQLSQTHDSLRTLAKQFNVHCRAFAFPFTDAGVSSTYFDQVFERGEVGLSFGGAGFKEDPVPWHFQRVSMEQQGTAHEIFALKSGQRLVRRIVGRNIIHRRS